MTQKEQRRIGATDLMVDTIGLGCAPLGNLYEALPDDEAAAMVNAAWDAGLRFFDTAPHYGQGLSERRLGDALRPRHEEPFVLATKVGRLLKPAGYADMRHNFASPMPFDIEYDYSYDGVLRAFDDSLQRMGLDRVDILFMHDIGRFTHGDDNERHFPIAMDGGYRAMDRLRREGRVAAIGLGVNEQEVCQAALEHGDWDCFLLAGRYTLLEQDPLDRFLPDCLERRCSIIIGGPYNSGILATGVRGKEAPYYDYGEAGEEIVERVAGLETACEEFGVPLPAAALQFPLAHPAVASILPGCATREQLLQSLDYFNHDIPADLWTALRERGLIRQDAPVPGESTGGGEG
jgi:D-threo-aldose 1-dehydrogenase